MKKKKIAKNILAHITLTILAVIWVMPLIWIILTSFRAQKGAYTSSFFPKAYTLDNYTKLFTDIYVFRAFSCLLYVTPQIQNEEGYDECSYDTWSLPSLYGNGSCILYS